MTATDNDIHSATITGGATRIQVEGVRKQALEMGRSRLIVAGTLIMMAFVAISLRLVDLMVMGGPAEPQIASGKLAIRAASTRSDIIDRNGILVATSLPTASLYADPMMVPDAASATEQLAKVLPELNRTEVLARLTSKHRFVWLKRNLTPDEQYAINRLGIPGVSFQREERRIYPHGALMSHVVGLTDTDGRGIAGVERFFDGVLDGGEQPLRLSLDVRVQSLMRDELMRTMTEFNAIGASGVIMDANTGEVLAMVSLPDFDPNVPGAADFDSTFNRATKGVYEMGSTFKLFTAAMALDLGVVGLEDGYDASEPIKVGRFTITDYHGKNRWLSVPEILIYSSNIGSAKMAMNVGTDRQKHYMDEFGLLHPADIELPEVGTPLVPSPWRDVNTMTISYGHGIAVSPLQLTSGVATLVNGGMRHQATLLSIPPDAAIPGERVLSRETSIKMRALMRLVVSRGTGKNAEAEGYLVGGKTGTADKQVAGKYSRNSRIASFIGAFPINDP
ncbi:MAG: penicillin-binding protein 2, partial [Rhodospirillales bacterium]|nr:penicillin-binding protein 2 [Rhodospirillales bacterium]